MRARRELNACLYSQKMDGRNMPEYRSESARYVEVQSGDLEALERKFRNGEMPLVAEERILSEDAARNAMYHFVIASSALARACMEGGMGHDEAHTLADIYTRKADVCPGRDALFTLYEEMCLDFAERMREIRKESVISLHIRRCIDHIYENLNGDLSVRALAEVAGLNPTYLSRLFSKETGIPIKQFVAEARIDTAQNLLKYSDLSCLRISASLGFSSQSAFIEVFKRITGMTPKVYRERFYSFQK